MTGLAQPTTRQAAESTPAARASSATPVRTVVLAGPEPRAAEARQLLPPSSRDRLEASFAPVVEDAEPEPTAADEHEDRGAVVEAGPVDTVEVEPEPVALTTRERIAQRAVAAEVHEPAEPEPEPELDLEEGAAVVVALDAEKQRLAARATPAEPGDAPAVDSDEPEPLPDNVVPFPPRPFAYEEAPGTDAPAPEVAAVARGPPTHGEPVLSRAPLVQTKLAVSSPGDALEREADAVAARVVRDAAPALPLRARPAGGLQRAVPHARAPPAGSSRAVASALAAPGGGSALDPLLRGRIEPHVGVDLSSVRVRRDAVAAAAARDLHARAFTSGPTIFLAAESSPTDLGLIAHEAAHVGQQQTLPAARTTLMRDATDLLPDISVTDVIPDWILDGVRDAIRAIPGYTLLTYIVGSDPLTDEPVTADPQELVDTLLTYGPFGPAVGAVLQTIEVLGDIFDFVTGSFADHNLTLSRISGDIEAAWDELSVTNGIAGNVAIVRRYVDAFLSDVRGFVLSIVERVLEIVRSVVAEVAEPLLQTDPIAPVWNLTKKVIHYDPLRGTSVEAPTVEIIADFLRLIGEDQRLAQMEERGTLQQTADWLDLQLAIFSSLIIELGLLFSDAWAAIQPENLPDLFTNLEALAQRAFGFVVRVAEWVGTLLLQILELIKDALLEWLSEYAHSVPGFHLLTVILGQNPFTGEEVPRTAENLIKGFITLLPGGEETYNQLAESGVISDAAARIEGEMDRLGISLELITGIFVGIWDTLSLDDLLDPIGAFVRVLDLFGEPLSRLIEFIIVVIEVVVTLILRLMNFPSELLGSVISNTIQAISDIKRDPVAFFLNMVEALKLGFSGFFDNILRYLLDGLVAWLFRGLGQIGIQLPTDLSLGSILTLVFQVLGLTIEHLWEKLAEHIGPERVQMIRDALDMLSGAWSFIQDVQREGLSAVWRFLADQLGALWSTLLDMALEWIMQTIVVNATVKLLSFLDPSGIMAVINSCIAIFNAIQSAIEYFRDMLEVLNQYVSTLAAVAAGNIMPGAQMLEAGLASIIPIAIGFLAKQVGLGNVPEKIVELIGRLREIVDAALDWLIEQALRIGRAVLDTIMGRTAETPEEAPPVPPEEPAAGPAVPLTPEERERLYADVAGEIGDGRHAWSTPEEGRGVLSATFTRFAPRGLRSLALAPAQGHIAVFDVEAEASPGQKVGSVAAEDRFSISHLLSRYITSLSATLNGEELTPVLISRGKSEGDHEGHAENWLLTYVVGAFARRQFRHGERNEIDVRITRSPCPVCQRRLLLRLEDIRSEDYEVRLTVRTASIHRFGTESGVEAFVELAMLDEEEIRLEPWDIIAELDELNMTDEEREALRANTAAVAWLQARVGHVRELLEAIRALRYGEA